MTTFHLKFCQQMMITTNKDKDQTKKGCEDSWHEELKSKEKKTIHENAGVLL